jgi:hypothetical protein
VTAALAASLVGCGGSRDHTTALKLTATNHFAGTATFHLRCAPPGGDIADPARACGALRSHPSALLSPKPFVCWGGTASWWDVRITGRFDGRRVVVSTSTCWTRQMELIDRLGLDGGQLWAHTAPPPDEVLRASSFLAR